MVIHKINESELKKKIVVIKHSSLEKNSLIRKVFNIFFIPLLNILPIKARGFIERSNSAVKEIISNATNHKALEIIYHTGNTHKPKSIYEKISQAVWFSTNNSKAVRNRLKIVNNELSNSISLISKKHEVINIASIAAGSARAVIESLEKNIILDKKVNVTFIDKSKDAIEYSKQLIKNYSISKLSNYSFEWLNLTVNSFLDSVSKKYSIVEMVGLMDYFDDKRASNIFLKIFNNLETNGVFITANINFNSEKSFVTKAIGWPMVYRKAEHIARLVQEAGFPHTNMDIYYEPLRIHSIIVARKD